jgi:pimeloyl-ACP methyl ester carboxylesterase
VKVIEQLAANHEEIWLIGHSGGGTLAVLLGRRLNRPVKVVTVSANLDHQAWTEHHQYTPLTGSLNPIRDLARNPDMQELHWYATEDRNILPAWVLAYCHKHQTQCLPVSGGHSDGWPARWPAILSCSRDFFAQLKWAGPDSGADPGPAPPEKGPTFPSRQAGIAFLESQNCLRYAVERKAEH